MRRRSRPISVLAAAAIVAAGLVTWAQPATAADTCSAETRTVTDYKGRPFGKIYHCSTYVSQTMYANPQDSAALDDVSYMYVAADVWVICQLNGRANPVIQGNTNTWWLYAQGDTTSRSNNYGFTNAWGFLPATAVTQGGQNEPIPGVPTCAIDYAVPGTPTVSSAKYPADANWYGAAGETGSFTLTPVSGTGDLAGFVYGLDTNPPTTFVAATGQTTVSVTPDRDGPHTLYVRTKDKAGNLSPARAYSFKVGRGAVTSPTDGQRTPRRVRLAAAFRPEHTQVTFQYRRGEADSWKTVPAADTVKASDGSAITWPVATTNGASPDLLWDAAHSLPEDGTLDVRALFTSSAGTSPTSPTRLVLDRNADGAATTQLGPGTLNLLTGDYEVSATDASAFDLAISRTVSSRSPDAGGQQEGQVAPFGPQWTGGGVAQTTNSEFTQLRKTSATSVEIVRTDGSAIGFTLASDGAWTSEPGAERLALTGSLSSGGFTLTSTDGTVTTFEKVDPAATSYPVRTTAPASDNSTTLYVAEKVTQDGALRARLVKMIAPTSAVASPASCNTASGTAPPRGCEVLELVYADATTATADAFGDVAGRVKEVKAWATDPEDGTAKAVSMARYAYDASGRLRETWDPRVSPALKTAYEYDQAGRVTKLIKPGELPWTFSYGKAGNPDTAGEGMLLKASRPTLTPGSKSGTNGTATTSVVYDVPTSGTGAPYAMGTGDVAKWGQGTRPVDATAVFPADQVPAAHTGRGQLASGDYQRATVQYLELNGRPVNTAQPGGHIDTTEYDKYGNTVRELSAANRALALGQSLGATDRLVELGIVGQDTPDRAHLLSQVEIYDIDAQRELQTLGPLHMVVLAEGLAASNGQPAITPGSRIAARKHLVNEYDGGRPTDGSAKVTDLVTKVSTGAAVPGYATDADVRARATEYDWTTGLELRTVEDPAGLALTRTTTYNQQGRPVKTTMPRSNGSDAGATVTTYWSAGGTGTCAGRPEWADLPCRIGPAGDITGGGSNPSELATKTMTYDFWGQQATVTETANGVTRTTANTFDTAGRGIKKAVTGGLGTAVAEITTEYDPATGKVAKTVASTGGQIVRDFDTLGRLHSYSDADGGRTTYAYDTLDRPVEVADSLPSKVTYAYDTAKEPRGLATSMTDSVAGTFTATYNVAGGIASQTLPGGIALAQTTDEAGGAVRRTYTRTGGSTLLDDAVVPSVHGQWLSRTGSASWRLTYDKAARLTAVEETANGVCTRRRYAFDANSNRTSKTTATGAAGSACPATGGTTVTHAYDSADRLVDDGNAYDALGRTTTLPNGTAIGYYANDRVRSQTQGSRRMTWSLDPAMRAGSWTVENRDGSGTWSQVAAKANHYGGESDSPRWIVEDTSTGAVTRNVLSIEGGLAATTAKTGDVKLHLTGLHGDVNVVFDVASGTSTAQATDEYGVPSGGQPAGRYGWLGGEQRSTETLGNTMLMGARLYSPESGRFLQTDPVQGGSANSYDYCSADPASCVDTTGYGSSCSVVWVNWYWYWYRVTLCGVVINLSPRPILIARDRCSRFTVCSTSPVRWLYPWQSSRRYWPDTDAWKKSWWWFWVPVYDGQTAIVWW